MDFNPVAGFPNGWTVGFQTSPSIELLYPEKPFYKAPDGKIYEPAEAATLPEGRELFHHTKRWLDIADQRYGYGAQSQPDWRAMDKAKMAMHLKLEEIGAMSDELLSTELDSHETGH